MSDHQFSVIGVIHLLPLPGTPNSVCDFTTVLQRALYDAEQLKKGGVHSAILENFGDAPFLRERVEAHVVAMMSVIAYEITAKVGLTLGINVLRNDAQAAMAIAAACQATFIRVNVHTGAAWTDQGLIQGNAYQTLMYRKQLQCSVDIAADVMVKHASPAGSRSLLDSAKDVVYRGGAKFVIVTGQATGGEVNWADLQLLKDHMPDQKLWIGSGLTPKSIAQAKKIADAGIIGTYFHEHADLNRPLCAHRVAEVIAALY